jgi:hypothetical protein
MDSYVTQNNGLFSFFRNLKYSCAKIAQLSDNFSCPGFRLRRRWIASLPYALVNSSARLIYQVFHLPETIDKNSPRRISVTHGSKRCGAHEQPITAGFFAAFRSLTSPQTAASTYDKNIRVEAEIN